MNFRRGFFRLWVILSVLFVGAVGLLSYNKIASEFTRANANWYKEGILLVPMACKDAIGKVNEDYTGPDRPWNAYSKEPNCWYKIPTLRRLFSEYATMPEDRLVSWLYKRAEIPIQEAAAPWTTLGVTVLIGISVPFFVLIVGIAVAWALSGFTAARTQV